MAQVKCQYCSQKGDKSEMVKQIKGYIHTDCLPAYIKKQEFKHKEREDLDELTDTIIRIMGYTNRQSIPTQFYSTYLQPFRNDDVLFGKIEKKYKEGFSYKTISDTFKYCENDIKKYVSQKRERNQFKTVLDELRYAFAVVRNNIENMLNDKKKRLQQETKATKTIESIDAMTDVFNRIKEVQNKQEDDDGIDITTLLD